jgi:MFS family permease
MGIAIATFILLYGSYLTFFPQYLSDAYGTSSANIGIFLSLMSVSTAIFSFNAGAIMRRVGRICPVALAFALYAVSFAIMGASPGDRYLYVAVSLFGVGQGLNLPSLQVMVLDSVPSTLKASISALYASTLRIGQSIGPVLIGACYARGSYDAVFTGSVILAALVFVCILFVSFFSSQRRLCS